MNEFDLCPFNFPFKSSGHRSPRERRSSVPERSSPLAAFSVGDDDDDDARHSRSRRAAPSSTVAAFLASPSSRASVTLASHRAAPRARRHVRARVVVRVRLGARHVAESRVVRRSRRRGRRRGRGRADPRVRGDEARGERQGGEAQGARARVAVAVAVAVVDVAVARLRRAPPSVASSVDETKSKRNALDATLITPSPLRPPPLRRAAPQGFVETMGFAGWAPEVINGRVAQIAFVAGAAAEAVTGETLPAQAHDHVFSLAFVSSLIALASFMPNVQGEKYTSEPESKGAFGPFSPGKELLHGRLAMVGLAAWIAIESHTGVAFFHR